MIIKAKLSIGYPGAIQEEDIEIDDDEFEGMSDIQREGFIDDVVREWAEEKVEYWYE